ncbi:MAG: hypothetical protein AAGA58_16515 [Verrucomicrobiota bacterium]
MKTFPLFLLCFLALALSAPAGVEKTAKYLHNLGEDKIGSTVSVEVSHVVPVKDVNEIAEEYGIAFFTVHTINEDTANHGGVIQSIVLKEEAERFQKRYGLMPETTRGRDRTVDTRIYRATLHEGMGDRYCLLDSEEAGKLAVDFKLAMEAEREAKKEEGDSEKRERMKEKVRDAIEERENGKGKGKGKGKGRSGDSEDTVKGRRPN